MKKLYLLLLILFSSLHAGNQITSYLAPHSPSINLARIRTGLEIITNDLTENKYWPIFSLSTIVNESFRDKHISRCFFGKDLDACTEILTISGSQTDDRCPNEWLADYFGLPTDFKSCIHFRPRLFNALIEPQIFWQCINRVYFLAYMPWGYAQHDLNMAEKVVYCGTNDHAQGYFDTITTPRKNLLHNFCSFASGCAIPQFSQTSFEPLCKAKMNPGTIAITDFAELQLVLGWRAIERYNFHFDINIRGAIPGGTKPKGEFLFEPIIGNGHHYEIGGGISMHYEVWHNLATEQQVTLSFDFAVTHLFKTWQCRSFDLCNKPNSRYMLALQLDTPIEDNLRGQQNGQLEVPTQQFKNNFIPLANITTMPVEVSIDFQLDLAGLITYEKKQWNYVFGYGFWRRSCEIIYPCDETIFDECNFALKGDAHIFGFEIAQENAPIALSATQNRATIHHGRNFPIKGTIETEIIQNGKTNPRIDNPLSAIADSTNSSTFNPLAIAANNAQQINTSIQPILLHTNDIDFNSSSTHASAHKILGYFGYTWKEKKQNPYAGIGAQVELGHDGKSTGADEFDCINCSISFWSVWIKGGFTF